MNDFLIYMSRPPESISNGVFIDHVFVDILYILHKLDLAQAIYVEGVYETMYDFDEGRDIDDLIGYTIHESE